MNITEKIRQFFKGDVVDDEPSLNEYSRDASIFTIKPRVVAFPKDVNDIKNLVKFVSREKLEKLEISLTPRAAGTDMSGGPLTDSIVVSTTKYLNHVKEVGDLPAQAGLPASEEGGYAITEPGVFYRDFDKLTREKGYILPSYPASRELCAVGGMVGNNSGGEKNLAYGETEKWVESLKMVLADGNEVEFGELSFEQLEKKKKGASLEAEIYQKMSKLLTDNYDEVKAARPQVSKNSSGYFLWNVMDREARTFDLSRMIVGSQGTLGIITEIKFRLVKPKNHARMLIILLKDLNLLPEVVNKVMAYKPESFESYDDNTMKIGLKFFPDILKIMKGNLFTMAFQFLPEFWMVLTGGIPKLILMAEFTGDSDEEAYQKTAKAHESLRGMRLKTKITKTEKEIKKYWTFRRESFNLLRHHMKGTRTAPFIDDVIVRPEKLPEFLPKLNALLKQYDLTYTIAGHIGDGNFHIIPLMKLSDPEAKEVIENLSKQVYKLVVEYGGSITAEHNDGLVRSPFVRAMFGPKVFSLFEQTEKIFDPQNIFNPVKKINATLEYSMEHLDTKI